MASAQVTWVRGADPVAASRRARLCWWRYRIVITGAGGQVGRFLAAEAGRRGLDVLALTSAQWDITDADAAERIVAPGDVVVNCAAYTAVDAAESDAERAHAVNAVGPGNVARACAKAGARMIHISTDYVFSGVVRRRAPAVRRRRRHRAAQRLRQDQAGRRAGGARGAPGRPRGADVRGCTPASGPTSSASCAGWRPATSPSAWSSTRSGRRPTSRDLVAALLEIAERPDGAAAAARRQRRRGQPVRAGAGGVRGRRGRPRTGATGVHRGRAAARGAAAVFGAVRPRRDGRGPGAAATVA